MRDEGLPLVLLSGTVGVDIVHMGKVGLESVRIKSASAWSSLQENLLFFTQCNHFIHVEQLLTPFSKIGRVLNNLCAEMAITLLI